MRSDMSGSVQELDRGARSATKDLACFQFSARLRVYGRILHEWQAADVRLRTFNCERVQHICGASPRNHQMKVRARTFAQAFSIAAFAALATSASTSCALAQALQSYVLENVKHSPPTRKRKFSFRELK